MVLDFGFSERFLILFHFSIDLVQVVLQILEHHVQFIGDQKHLFQFDDILVV